MKFANIFKLKSILAKFGEIVTSDGKTLSYNGELGIGTEVFIEEMTGEIVPAPDGTYNTNDMQYVVTNGAIESMTEITPAVENENPSTPEETNMEAEMPIEEPAVMDPAIMEAKIAELEAEIAKKQAEIESITKQLEEANMTIADYEAKAALSVEESAEEMAKKKKCGMEQNFSSVDRIRKSISNGTRL